MADMRQSTAIKDDFNRADEEPLSGGGNWGRLDAGVWTACRNKSNVATEFSSGTSSMSYWTPETFDGDEAEAWATALGGNASGTAWGIGLFQQPGGTNQTDGYRFREEISSGGGATRLYKYTNGSATTLDSNAASPSTGNPGIFLIRRNGNDVEGWVSADGGSTWTMYVSATDTSYVNGLYLAIGITDNSSSNILYWDDFGGGPAPVIPWTPHIIRRPHQQSSGGVWLP